MLPERNCTQSYQAATAYEYRAPCSEAEYDSSHSKHSYDGEKKISESAEPEL